MDPLILAGDRVVPLVIRGVADRNMPKRRYAIQFLGNGGFDEAVPVLRRILADKAEDDWMRADALQAIYMIQQSEGAGLAVDYREQDGVLGTLARRAIAGDPELL